MTGLPASSVVVAPFIDGALSRSDSEASFEVINPSNGKRCMTIPAGCVTDVDHAVAAARRAFEDGRWSELPPSQRKCTLYRLADAIAANAKHLDALDAGEMGKPLAE